MISNDQTRPHRNINNNLITENQPQTPVKRKIKYRRE